MAKEDAVPTPAFEAIAWLDPAVTTRRHSLKLDRHAQPHTIGSPQQDSPPLGRGAADAASDDSEETQEEGVSRGRHSIGSRRAESSSPSVVSGRHMGMAAAATQFLLLLALGVTVFGVMLYDSTLYHGVDMFGQPVYLERPFNAEDGFDVSPISADSAVGNDESKGSLVLPGTAFLNGTIPEGSPVYDADYPDIAAPG